MTKSINIIRMKKFRLLTGLLAVMMTSVAVVHAQQTIIASSQPNAVNLTSDGKPMTPAFKFKLGVFAGSFVPTAENTVEWAANWHPAAELTYSSRTNRFAGEFVVTSNITPFTAGKTAYIWGAQGSATKGEWILFRANSWTWPSAGGLDSLEWLAEDATTVLGEINASGSPHLMKSVAIVDSIPGTSKETWSQWQAAHLAGKEKNLPHEDADDDGVANILKFAFGMDAGRPGQQPHTPVSKSGDHLVITVPRRQDREANVAVEVSSDLVNWYDGPSHTEVLEDGPAGLVVKDLTPIGPEHPSRFMRVKVAEP